MESQNLKQRIRDESTKNTTNVDNSNNNINKNRRAKRTVMAKRGLRSLTLAVAFPLSLTLFTIYCSAGSGSIHGKLAKKPFFWALHLASLASSFLMGLSAWLVWAEGGFHRQPTALYLYLAQLILGLSWAPITFTYGATRFGLIVCVSLFGALVGCSQSFRRMNPIAADLVKPCLAWVAFMTIVNFKLLYV
ncbi:translocator protein homolog [Telopea speciosissima]|uniref:translocator protein homolog n=1 Tax=Telopea speciosissima TaxID=54955 RepID=UPI001CC4F3B4|nr:translocator protein homolog [Telopea speciosissima]